MDCTNVVKKIIQEIIDGGYKDGSTQIRNNN